MDSRQQNIKSIEQIKSKCNQMAESTYSKLDSLPQSFYFTLISMLNIQSATNILQVGCGTGLLIPHTVSIKNKLTKYVATDLSEKMIELTHKRLQNHHAIYKSKQTVQEWMDQNRLIVRTANGQQPFGEPQKFDRIICNLVLMITENAETMLKNLYNEAKSGCLMGITIWGDRTKSQPFSLIETLIEQDSQIKYKERSNFHLYKRLQQKAEKTGWKVILKWEQNGMLPYLNSQQMQQFANLMTSYLSIPQQKKQSLKIRYMNKIKENFDQKIPGTFSGELYILKKQ